MLHSPSPEKRPALLGGDPVCLQGPPAWPQFDEGVAAAAANAMADGSWGRYLGPHGDRLRSTLAELHGVKHVRLCSSGTAAVEFALRGVGVGPGDEVILAAYDFEANIKNVFALGATPILADIRGDDAQLDVEPLNEIDSPKVKALLVSHLHGGVVDLPRLRGIADARGWAIVEDVCQSPGAWIFGRRAGTWGDVGVMSFGGSKLLTAGRGGAIVSDRDDVMQRIRLHAERGNDLSPLSEMQSALLLPQIDPLDERHRIRHVNASHLAALLEPVAGVTPLRPSTSSVPQGGPHLPAYYKFGAWYDPSAFENLPRGVFCAALRAEGFAFWPGFRSLHRTHASRRFRVVSELIQASRADEQLVVLHHPILLGCKDALNLLVEAIGKVRAHAAALRDAASTGAYDVLAAK